MRGRLSLFRENVESAISSLTLAVELNPLPEYQWALLEALEKAGRNEEALELERRLIASGSVEDPRTLALFLATRGESDQLALRLAMEELEIREDVHTLDAVSWTLQHAGRLREAARFMERALAEGTQDARLFLHAGVIAAEVGDAKAAASYLRLGESHASGSAVS